MYKLDPRAPVTPFDPAKPVSATNRPVKQQFYISAYEVVAEKVEISTATGDIAQVGPAYIMMEKTKIGTGPAANFTRTIPANPTLGIDGGDIPLLEPKNNIVVRGFVTDPTQLVDILAIDVDPADGTDHPRLLGSILPEPGPPGMGNKGRFRFEVDRGAFLPVTREYLVRTEHGQVAIPPQIGLDGVPIDGTGSHAFSAGEYTAPNFDYQIADAPPGFPISASNFNEFPFLQKGESPTVGPLTPFPVSTP